MSDEYAVEVVSANVYTVSVGMRGAGVEVEGRRACVPKGVKVASVLELLDSSTIKGLSIAVWWVTIVISVGDVIIVACDDVGSLGGAYINDMFGQG